MGTDYTPLTDIALLLRAANYAAARTQLGLAEAFKAGIKGSNIASSGTAADIGASTGQVLDITGTTTITAFPTATAGIVRMVRFTGALILTHNATSLQLPGAANITTAAGDVGVFESLGSGNWKCAIFQAVSGKAVIPPAFADTTGFASSAQGAKADSALQFDSNGGELIGLVWAQLPSTIPITKGVPPIDATTTELQKGDGAGGLENAVAGTDFQLPLTAGTDYLAPNGNGSALTSLTAGNLTGVVAAANGGAGAVTGLLKADGMGAVSAAVSDIDYATPAGVNIALVYQNSAITPAADGTYALPTSITIQSGIITAIS